MSTSTETATDRTPPAVDDYIVVSWGYDQTNVDFYRVLSVTKTGKSMKIQRVRPTTVGDTGPQIRVAPTKEVYTRRVRGEDGNPVEVEAETLTKRVAHSRWDGGLSITFDHGVGRLWDGKPETATGPGYGH